MSGSLLPLLAVGAVLAGLLGESPAEERLPDSSLVAGSYDGFDAEAAEQLRLDQCLMADALRVGGSGTSSLGQAGLNQSPEHLRVTADREYWNDTPLADAFIKDRELIDQEMATLDPRLDAWEDAFSGLSAPGGFSYVDFYWPPRQVRRRPDLLRAGRPRTGGQPRDRLATAPPPRRPPATRRRDDWRSSPSRSPNSPTRTGR
ncbi:hypothetical protein [Streptomyces daghestanicus]|nr:hypothetical protein [Streptomyces daghestanicus]GGU70739.1 hypothetical protein GCM10010259_70340 [Streptomyces daghestanicus]